MQRAVGHAGVSFRSLDGTTRLERLFQDGCAKIRLPKTLGVDDPQAILINTAGGLTGGDRLATEVNLGADTAACVTTQACERVYRSTGPDATLTNHLRVSAGARLAWLPQETILFDGGRLSRRLDADLEGDAELVAVEAVLFGRMAMGETLRSGLLHDRWRVRRDGRLIFADDLRFEGDIAARMAPQAVMAGRRAMATVLFTGAAPERFLESGPIHHWTSRRRQRVERQVPGAAGRGDRARSAAAAGAAADPADGRPFAAQGLATLARPGNSRMTA